MRDRRIVAFILALACLILPVCASASESEIPKDADQFSAYVAGLFEKAEPTAKVVSIGPLTIDIKRADGDHTLYLNRIWDICQRDEQQCGLQVKTFVTDMSAMARESNGAVTPSDIRVVVRGTGYIEPMQQIAAKYPDKAGVFRPLAGDLWMVCVIDRPHGIETLSKAELAKLGLTEDQAFAVGIKNLTAALPPLEADTHVIKQFGLKVAAGDFYESSRMLAHESWAELSKFYNGHLVVAVPNNDVLIYGDGGGDADRAALADFTHDIIERAPKPISETLFEWTETGWKVVKP